MGAALRCSGPVWEQLPRAAVPLHRSLLSSTGPSHTARLGRQRPPPRAARVCAGLRALWPAGTSHSPPPSVSMRLSLVPLPPRSVPCSCTFIRRGGGSSGDVAPPFPGSSPAYTPSAAGRWACGLKVRPLSPPVPRRAALAAAAGRRLRRVLGGGIPPERPPSLLHSSLCCKLTLAPKTTGLTVVCLPATVRLLREVRPPEALLAGTSAPVPRAATSF